MASIWQHIKAFTTKKADANNSNVADFITSTDNNDGTKRGIDVSSINDNLDAFGRLRVSEVQGIFENKNLYDKNTNRWSEVTNGVGASITYVANKSSVDLDIGTVSGEYAIRQTLQYMTYIPGKSQFVTMTGVMGAGQTNTVRRIGYFDDNDGLFFELNGTTKNVAVRTSTSGSPVDTAVAQTNWNIDKLDGSGASGITIDWTKAQIFIIDFQWLSVGRVRFGFDIDGELIYCHEVLNANNIALPYMATPNLPLRYEIRNTGTAAGASKLTEICCAVASEAGYIPLSLEFSVSNGTTTRSVTTRTPILAIRLKNSFNSKANRVIANLLSSRGYVTTNDAFFELVHVHNPSAITATWVSAGADSAVEYSTNITAVTGNPSHVIESGYIPAGVGAGAGAQSTTYDFIQLHKLISQNFDSTNSQMFVIYATSFSGTANVSTSIVWQEFS